MKVGGPSLSGRSRGGSDTGSILLRYGETGLKKHAVKARFIRRLLDNIEDAFASVRLECTIDGVQGRYILTTPDTDRGVDILSHVFGIVSVSPVAEFPSELDRLCDAVGGWSRDRLDRGASFAIRARRTGTHPYTSMDVNKRVGSAVFLVNEDKGVRVDLTSPDVLIEVEIRGRSAFAYTDRVDGPGGLPYGSGGRMVCYLRGERDALGAWMLMRRGCRMFLYHPDEAGAELAPVIEALSRWVPGLGSRPLSALVKREEREVEGGGAGGRGGPEAPPLLRRAMEYRRAAGFVTGASMAEVEAGTVVTPEGKDVLVLYPLVGLGEEETARMRARAGMGAGLEVSGD